MSAETPKFGTTQDALATWEQDKVRFKQDFYKDMYRSGKLSPYQKDRPGIDLKKVGEAWKDPSTQGETSRIMAVDLALRGGADKQYNQLGDMSRRLKRMEVMAENMIPNIALDILTSIPQNLAEKAVEEVFKVKLKDQQALPATAETKKAIEQLKFRIKSLRSISRLIGVMNDKNVTAWGDTVMHWRTGEKTGWFTGESADKLNDLVSAGFPERIEDFVNGPTLESAFRAVYQVPVVGALVEQAWTRWTLFQGKTAYHKGNLKAVYAATGMFIGLMRNVDDKEMQTPSWWITNKLWNKGEAIYEHYKNAKGTASQAA